MAASCLDGRLGFDGAIAVGTMVGKFVGIGAVAAVDGNVGCTVATVAATAAVPDGDIAVSTANVALATAATGMAVTRTDRGTGDGRTSP
jgi:hypothetical protein